MRIIFVLFVLNIFVFAHLKAESGRMFSADKELSNSLLYDMHQDCYGVIWIATEDGLNRYDGSKFTIYRHDNKNPKSLQHNYVRVLFEDSQKRYFIGLLNGLQLYDHATDTFEKVLMLNKSGIELSPHVFSILERKNHEILIGTSGQGIFKLVQDKDRFFALQVYNDEISYFISCLYEDQKGNLWVATQDKGLFRLNHNYVLKSFLKNGDVGLNSISSICEDEEGHVLVGSLTKGLFMHDEKTDSFLPVDYSGGRNLPIKTLFINSPEEIFLGTDGLGMKIYKTKERAIVDTTFNISSFNFEKSKVHSILRDNAGNTWLGIFQKGVILIPEQTNKFNYIGYKSVRYNTIGTNCVMSLCEDRNGIVWVGADNDGIYGVHLKGGQYAHFYPTGKPNSVPSTLMAIFEDSNQDLWLGSYLNGMGRFDRNNGRYEQVKELVDDNGSPIERVYCFAEDWEKNLWVGTHGGGLYRMDLRTRKITNFNRPADMGYGNEQNVLANYWINCLLLSSDSTKLYIGTYDGLLCLDIPKNDYGSTFGTVQLLKTRVIYSIYEDKPGNIWLGTSEGLIRVDKDTHALSSYSTEDGLSSKVICAIRGDQAGNLWISTHYGISQFNPEREDFINYYASDGLQGNEFSKCVSFIDHNDNIIFGGINGITYFDPSEIKFQKKKLDVRISDFYIHDQPVRKGTKSGSKSVIDTTVVDANVFHLSQKDNSFSIEFTVMEFNTPERIVYSYKVNDENWISLHPGTNRVSFSNLTPGNYYFKVKAKDYNSYSDEKSISVIISPVWYFSTWAKLVYFLLFLSMLYLIVLQVRQRYRSRQRLLQHRHEQEINEAKLQFFMNIAHEIRTPMSLIISPLKKLMTTDTDKERRKSYGMINRNAERILNLINQLMDIRKIDKGLMTLKFQEVEMVSFLKELCHYFEYQSKTKNIRFSCSSVFERLDVWVDPKNFDKIIMNVLSNAFKYTPEGGEINICVDVSEVRKKKYCRIIISDTGIGIREDELELIFERFYQIRNSCNNSNVSTGIGLHLTRSLVELHHGEIKAESRVNEGTRFIIQLPLGCEHLKTEEIEENPDLKMECPASSEAFSRPFEDEDTKIRSKSKRRVMIIDDEEEIRKYVAGELAGEYHMIECSDGKDALPMILKIKPDLVISDIMMPGMDGIALCRKIKQNVNINYIPVILLTAKTKEEDNLEGLSIGADAYIVKPFYIELLKKTVENLIRNREILRNTYKGSQQQEDKITKIQIKSADEKLMERVMKVINANLANPKLNVEMIAEEVGISRVHLHRKLKELTNQSTRDLIRNIRLKQGADLLADKNLTISEVAEATGFTNLGYFSNAFKDLYGVPPSSYMEEHRKHSTGSGSSTENESV
ncbi:MAG: two-component regulator propeller domain-containing protein [Massilibacteroides sp.]|nr:two-component regulator propeller domain-containing protein [Massilibacteroides sp.]MDD4114941.1 two-component regulator propeller domain-containing protein [Massilibacteroides sp.]MDD4659130.1 two-component regulator propeller domain-containing protein [Massilibacteroides sp.]